VSNAHAAPKVDLRSHHGFKSPPKCETAEGSEEHTRITSYACLVSGRLHVGSTWTATRRSVPLEGLSHTHTHMFCSRPLASTRGARRCTRLLGTALKPQGCNTAVYGTAVRHHGAEECESCETRREPHWGLRKNSLCLAVKVSGSVTTLRNFCVKEKLSHLCGGSSCMFLKR